jgi:hypothetical protein
MVHEAYEGLGNGKSSLIFGKTDGVNGLWRWEVCIKKTSIAAPTFLHVNSTWQKSGESGGVFASNFQGDGPATL